MLGVWCLVLCGRVVGGVLVVGHWFVDLLVVGLLLVVGCWPLLVGCLLCGFVCWF